MIIVNENLKNDSIIDKNSCPLLFSEDDETGEVVQIRDFACYFDTKCNLIVQTTLSNNKQLQNEIEKFFDKQEQLCNAGIKMYQVYVDRLKAIKEMRGE